MIWSTRNKHAERTEVEMFTHNVWESNPDNTGGRRVLSQRERKGTIFKDVRAHCYCATVSALHTMSVV